MSESARLLLSINTGSSSVKLGVYRDGAPPAEVTPIAADTTLDAFLEMLVSTGQAGSVVGVGHRLVHGGPKYRQPCRIDPAVRGDLEKIVPLAPNHLPQALAAIDRVARQFPAWPQVACFDTAFHRTLPARARTLPLGPQVANADVMRYGFHGLSYEFLVESLRG
ncbi:MAG TPA: hypothetical protein VMF30_05710, partial [Pirellulales bacterium]|nr:hypothetical protein [Pirellulales bacterium]